ncbi:adenylosuccinate synthetase [Embleya sp. NPDC005575]|uniref:adenylosuccinate synthetase n=1 Tax=Embleya sp. NPDC005575 TaxID=3156892 RepID=UPI0033B506CF
MTPRHIAVVDLGFGDAGKGTTVDRLCARAREEGQPVHAVVRFNGGAQAAHNVVTDDGRHHTFAQFGSGTFTPGTRTHLSRFMLVDPLALAAEAEHLRVLGVPEPLALLTVDREALLTTPYHAAANRARELARGADRHGSCGMGVGETAAFALAHPQDAPRVGDCASPGLLRRRLTAVRDALSAEFGTPLGPDVSACVAAFLGFGRAVRMVDRAYARELLRGGPVVFEGAQGVLLDEWHGFHPYTTWSTTTFANAETLAAEAGEALYRLGVLRTYTTRHGAGPLPTEDAALTAALPDPHNGTGRWQGAFRVGHFDVPAHRYAVAVCGGVHGLALTHADVLGRAGAAVAGSYEGVEPSVGSVPDLARAERLTGHMFAARPVLRPAPAPARWPEFVAAELGAPVTLLSFGPRTGDKCEQPVLGSYYSPVT